MISSIVNITILTQLYFFFYEYLYKRKYKSKIILLPGFMLGYVLCVRVLPTLMFPDSELKDFMIPFITLILVSSLLLGYIIHDLIKAGSNKVKLTQPVFMERNLGFWLLLSILITFGIWFFQGLPPTLTAIKDLLIRGALESAGLVSDSRFSLTKGAYFGGEYRAQGLYSAVSFFGWSVLSIFQLNNLSRNPATKEIVFFIAIFFFSWMFIAGIGDRAPFLNYVIILFIAFSLIKAFSLRYFFLIPFFFIGLALILSLYSNKGAWIFSDSGNNILALIEKIFLRIFRGNAVADIYVIELIESGRWSLSYGYYFMRDMITSIPGISYGKPLAYELYMELNSNSQNTTFLTGTYLSKVYTDFYLLGVALVYFVIGFFTAFLERFMVSIENKYSLLFVPILTLSVVQIILSGIPGFLAALPVLFVIRVILGVKLYANSI